MTDKNESSRNGTMHAYAVEARHNFSEGIIVAGQAYGQRWKRVHFAESPAPFGVPQGKRYEAPELLATGLHSYAAAQALRWWFHAEADMGPLGALCLETRIVQYEVKYSCSWKPLTVHEHIHGEDRSNMMPDWGKKPGELTAYDSP